MPQALKMFFINTGNVYLDAGAAALLNWVTALVFLVPLLIFARLFTRVRKIQRRRRDWSVLRHELLWSALTGAVVVLALKYSYTLLVTKGYLRLNSAPASWYVVLFEFAFFVLVFDFYFYVVHRLIHVEPLYTWIHKVHHRSTAPIPLTNLSTHPVEGLVEAAFTPVFLTAFTVHEASIPFILPYLIIMGFIAHCGYEFAPKWWYRSWATKWIMTPLFHDQHHRYFKFNYGHMAIWDRVFGTLRPQFEEDMEKLCSGPVTPDQELEVA